MRRFLLPLILALPLAGCHGQNGGARFPGLPPMPPEAQLAIMADQPAAHTGFTFDRSMLQAAQNVLQQGGLTEPRAAAALTGITVDNYKYSQPAFYSPQVMSSVIATYRALGWTHLVNGNQTPQNTAQPRTTVTDLWMHYHGAEIDSLTVVTRSPLQMSVLQLHGELRPLDLLHLSGKFGIPTVDPDAVMVPERR